MRLRRFGLAEGAFGKENMWRREDSERLVKQIKQFAKTRKLSDLSTILQKSTSPLENVGWNLFWNRLLDSLCECGDISVASMKRKKAI